MSMNSYIAALKKETEPLRQQLTGHSLYANINSIEKLQIFMQYHVFAVWDFMSLLKTLQINLTCTTIPWMPSGSASSRYLINEIVTGEESDVDEDGKRTSHFEMYLDAMKQADAATEHIEEFISLLRAGSSVEEAINEAKVNEAASTFVKNTFKTIQSGKLHVQAAVFTFGREDLIPGMFITFVDSLKNNSGQDLTKFIYYLQRHIEVDGDHHSLLGYEMTSELCGNDDEKWREATEAVKDALQSRLDLWGNINALLGY